MANRPLLVEIETSERGVLWDLVGERDYEWNVEAAGTPPGVTVRVRQTRALKAVVPDLLELSVYIAGSVGIGLFTNWLYDRLTSKGERPITTIHINRREVTLERDAILRIVEEEITREDK